jgi:hypothetical protein
MIETFVSLARHHPRGRVNRLPGATVALTESPLALFNQLLLCWDAEPRALARAVEELRDVRWPWSVLLHGGMGEEHVGVLRSAHLEEVGDYFMVTMALCDPPPAQPPGNLDVRVVTDRRLFADFLVAAGPDRELSATWLDERILTDQHIDLFVGHVGGAPVATSMSVRTPGVVGVYVVNVVEAMRRRGFGWAMTSAAIMRGAGSASDLAVLQSSRMGYRMYAAHGFRRLFAYRCFRAPGGALSGRKDR